MCRGDVAEVEERLQAGEDLEQYALGYTPLMHAIEREQTEMITYLIDNGADVNAREDGMHENKAESPISLACLSGQEDVVAMLLQKGADPTYYNVENLNLLDLTSQAQYPKCEALLREHGMTPVESNEENH